MVITGDMLNNYEADDVMDRGSFRGELAYNFLAGTGRMLRYLAIKGEIDDWAVYHERAQVKMTDTEIIKNGAKASIDLASKIISFDNDARDRYRQ